MPRLLHPVPQGRELVVAEPVAEDGLSAGLELVLAAADADVVFDDDDEPELHAVSAAAAAASSPTDTAVPRRVITIGSFQVWSLKRSTTRSQSPFRGRGAMTGSRMLPVRNNGPIRLTSRLLSGSASASF
jgi:hypothetical protein